MKKEILHSPLPQSGYTEVPHDALGKFLKGDTEEWKLKWQDPNFTHQFPTLVQRFLSEDGHAQFLEEHGQEMIHSAVSAFMAIPWNAREKGHIAVNGIGFTQNGEVIPLERNELTASERPTVDSLMKAEIASLLLLGFSPSNKKYTKDFIVESYQGLTTSRSDSFRNNIFRFITDGSIVRRWVKAYNLDVQNSLSWDKDVTDLALSLAPPRYKNSSGGLRALPNELLNLEAFVPEALEVCVDYVIDYVSGLTKIAASRKDIQLFILEVEKLPDKSRYEEKLSPLKELSKPR